MMRKSIAAFLLIALSTSALAYVGPGAGLQMMGSLIGLLSALGASLFFLIVRPLLRWLGIGKSKKKTLKKPS